MKIANKKFVISALWLTLTGMALRVAGMGYRVFISARLGEAGMGLYQLVLSVYMLGATLATAGIGVAVTRLVSEQCALGSAAGVRRVMRFSLRLSATGGTMVAVVLFVGADGIARHLVKAPECAADFRILACGVPFMALSAALGGYFLARSQVQYSCISQAVEQALRITLVVVCIDRFPALKMEVIFVGNAVSEAACALLQYLLYHTDRRRIRSTQPEVGARGVFARFVPIALPIAAAKWITGSLHAAENLLVPRQIARFTGDTTVALSQFGALKGMALPLIMFPSSFLVSIASLLIPEITAAVTLRQYDKIQNLTQKVFRITCISAVCLGGVFGRFAVPLGKIMYGSDSVGEILKFLAPVVPFMYLDCVTDGMLKGMGQQVASLRYSTVDSAVRIALVLLLLPLRGLRGFLYVMALSNIGVSLLGLRRLVRVSGCKIPWKCLLCSVCGVAAAHLASSVIRDTSVIGLLTGGVIYGGIYLVFMLGSGALYKEDLKMLRQ